MSNPSVPYLSYGQLAQRVWWYAVIRGLIAIVIGVIVMANPTASVLFLVKLIGAFVLIDGVLATVDGLRRRGSPDRGAGWAIVRGVVGILAGLVLIVWPQVTVAFLAVMLGAWAIVAGALAALAGYNLRTVPGSGWGWGLFWGLLTVAFGFALIVLTTATIAVLAWVIGLYAVISGVVLVLAGFVIRTLGKHEASSAG